MDFFVAGSWLASNLNGWWVGSADGVKDNGHKLCPRLVESYPD